MLREYLSNICNNDFIYNVMNYNYKLNNNIN